MGAPVLGEVAEQVVDPTGEEIAGIASNMLESISILSNGIGMFENKLLKDLKANHTLTNYLFLL